METKGSVCSKALREHMTTARQRESQEPAQASSGGPEDESVVMSVRSLVGLPTLTTDQVGCFCYSKKEIKDRARIAETWVELSSRKESTSALDLKAAVHSMLELNLERMTVEQNRQMQVNLAKCIGEDGNQKWLDIKAFVALAGWTPEQVFDMLLTHPSGGQI